jgi:DNA invertase Pin-like site-specific DNA recombinase
MIYWELHKFLNPLFGKDNKMLKQQGKITALYCRLSQEDKLGSNGGDSSSIQTQKVMLSKYAEENGLLNCEYYIDDGATGVNFKREEFQRMVSDIEDGMVSCVITKDLSRLGRNYLEAGRYRELFAEYGVRYIAISDGYDSFTDDGSDIATPIKEIIHEFYARDVSRKIKSAFMTKAKNGGVITGYAPYGYQKVPGTTNRLEPDPVTAPNVRRMFQMALEGMACGEIARVMRGEKTLMPYAHFKEMGKKNGKDYKFDVRDPYAWLSGTVRVVLSNPVYTGNLVYLKTIKKSFKNKQRIKKGKDEWIISPNTHEALVSEHDFDTIQERIKVKQRAIKNNGFVNIFKGIIFCSDCQTRMSLTSQKEKASFRCNLFTRHGNSICTCHYITHDQLRKIALSDIRRHATLAAGNIKKYIKYLTSISENEFNGKKISLRKEADKGEKRLNEIDTLIQKLYEDMVFGILTRERFISMTEKLEAEQKELKSRFAEITEYLNSGDEKSRNIDSFANLIKQYTDIGELDSELVHTLIDKIVVHETVIVDRDRIKQIDIYYRFVGNINEDEIIYNSGKRGGSKKRVIA